MIAPQEFSVLLFDVAIIKQLSIRTVLILLGSECCKVDSFGAVYTGKKVNWKNSYCESFLACFWFILKMESHSSLLVFIN